MKTGQRSPNCVEQSLRLYDVLEVGFLLMPFVASLGGFHLECLQGVFGWLRRKYMGLAATK